jgi:hypothetical protein
VSRSQKSQIVMRLQLKSGWPDQALYSDEGQVEAHGVTQGCKCSEWEQPKSVTSFDCSTHNKVSVIKSCLLLVDVLQEMSLRCFSGDARD